MSLFIIAIFNLLTYPAFAQNEKPLGLIVYSKPNLNTSQKSDFKKTLDKMGFKISHQGSYFSFIYIQLKNRKSLKQKDTKKYCPSIVKKNYILSCHADFKPVFAEGSEATNTDSSFTTTDFFDNRIRINKCKLHRDTPDVQYEGRSDFWAQEAVGADLVDGEKDGKSLEKVPAYICDDPTDNHEADVKSIVDGNNSFNKSLIVENCQTLGEKLMFLEKATKVNRNVIVNHSIYLTDNDSFPPKKSSFLKLFNKKSSMEKIIWAQGAGNFWKDGTGIGLNNKRNSSENYFVVGSLSPKGLPSVFSQEDRGVLISAPSDNSITVCPENKKKCNSFSGTSGSTPQLTHAIKAVLERAPQMNKKQIRELIKRTHIPMPHSFERPRKNGVGMLNSYKMWKVAQKISKACGAEKECARKLLNNPRTYNFGKLIWDSELKSSFPYCFGKKTAVSCRKQKKSFKKLRQAAFLEPGNKELWKVLACAQAKQGHYNSEAFYKNIGRDFNKKPFTPEELDIKSIDKRFIRYSKYFKNLGALIKKYDFKGKDIEWLRGLGVKGIPLLKKAASSKDHIERLWAVIAAKKFESNVSLPILRRAVNDSNRRVRRRAHEELKTLSSFEGKGANK